MTRASALLVLLVLACQGDPVGEAGSDAGGVGGGGTGGGATGGGSAGTGTGGTAQTGPGPFGALPAGYCCSADAECRFRNCADFGGVKMCSDECSHTGGCITGKSMICSASGYCEPSGTPECIPAESFVLGTKDTGACCVATGDGESGVECKGGRCVAVGDLQNPFICTQACAGTGDCPPKYTCLGFSFCAPMATLYDCE